APATPHHLLGDEDEIPLGDGRSLEVVWTPGHTPGHCCLLLRPDGILFVGDHLLPKITPHVGLWPNGPENPLGDFLASHEKIQRLDARLVCPAHGAVYEDHRRRARQLIDFHRVRKLAMLDRIRRHPLPPTRSRSTSSRSRRTTVSRCSPRRSRRSRTWSCCGARDGRCGSSGTGWCATRRVNRGGSGRTSPPAASCPPPRSGRARPSS